MNANYNSFPRPAWTLLFSELGGYDLINTIYHDDFTGLDHFHYEFRFNYRNHKARLAVKDFTYIRELGKEYYLKICFDYDKAPSIDIMLRKWQWFFALWSKIRYQYVSLKNTPLYREYLFESNKPGLASRVTQNLLFIANDPFDSYITNNNVDPKTGKYSLDFTSPVWIEDYDELMAILENTCDLFEQSVGIELLSG